MNPNFWRAIVLTSRYQMNLGCAELTRYNVAASLPGVLSRANIDGSVTLIDTNTGDSLPAGLSMDSNRIRCQLEMYRGLVRLKAMQSLSNNDFKSTAKFEVRNSADEFASTGISAETI